MWLYLPEILGSSRTFSTLPRFCNRKSFCLPLQHSLPSLTHFGLRIFMVLIPLLELRKADF